jgi:hypothetical protein
MKTLEEIKLEYNKSPKEFIRSVERAHGIKIKKVEIIDDTPDFKMIVENAAQAEFSYVRIHEPFLIVSLIEDSKGYTMKVHNCLTFYLFDGSIIRYSPAPDNKLDLSRIEMAKPGNGEGSFLIEFTFDYFLSILDKIPPIQVELTGAVGVGDKLKETDIEKQQRFFARHGFEVTNKKNGIIQMERP